MGFANLFCESTNNTTALFLAFFVRSIEEPI